MKGTFRIAALGADGSAPGAGGFESFTYPRLRTLLPGAAVREGAAARIAVGAWMGREPAGLAFYSQPWASHTGTADALEPGDGAASAPSATKDQRRLLSVMVHPLARRNGLAMRLLETGEALAHASGTRRIVAVHSSRMQAREAFERLLAASGWKAPEEFEFRLAGRAAWAERARADWAGFLRRLDARGFGTTCWQDLGDAERAQLERMAQDLPEADRAFNPFMPGLKVVPLPQLSIVLRRDRRIVGWIVGSTGALPDSIHYSYGYVLPELQRLGWLAAGVRDVCERQARLHGGASLSVLETQQANVAMRRFMERQLRPYSEWTDSRYTSEKLLQP